MTGQAPSNFSLSGRMELQRVVRIVAGKRLPLSSQLTGEAMDALMIKLCGLHWCTSSYKGGKRGSC